MPVFLTLMIKNYILQKRIILISAVFSMCSAAMGQGCSDAGFCTMGAMRPNQSFSSKSMLKLRSVELLQYVGVTKFHDVILTSLVDINIGVGEKGSVQLKLPYTFVSGPLADTKGMGDISCSYTHTLLQTETFQVLGTIGAKLPTNNSNKVSSDGRPLPMYYQTSLGSYDVVAGLSFVSRKWLLAAGYQQALTKNGNEFRWSEWKGSALNSEALEYPVSWNVKRGKDLMFRVERNFRSTKWNGYIGLLTVFRFTKDDISKGKEDVRIKAAGTDGAAITALSGLGYRFSTTTAIKALFGYKVLSRLHNADGLSREYVASLSMEFRF